MHHTFLQPHRASDLKKHVRQMENSLKRLSSMNRSHIRELERSLNRISGGSARPNAVGGLAGKDSNPFSQENLFPELLKGVGSSVARSVSSFASDGAGDGRLSQGQLMSDMAKALNRAMGRYL